MSFKPYLNQDFNEIKSDLLKNGNLFVDNDFPAETSSLIRSNGNQNNIEWKRAKDLVESNAKFILDEPNGNRLVQGYIGNGWFVAVVVEITKHLEYFNLVVPPGQSFDDGEYCGAFHFRFWRYGEWVDVVVDDFLPVISTTNSLVYGRSVPNEFWFPLLEKAYAKLGGSYESMNGGFAEDALIDLTGGVEETFQIEKLNPNSREYLWKYLKQAFNRKSLGVAISIRNDSEISDFNELKFSNGIIANQPYSITKVTEVDSNQVESVTNKNENVKLIRLRNPWGGDNEWNGPFSDSSPEWQNILDSVKADIGLVKEKDGEFWMPLDDFIINFETLSFVHVDMNLSYEPTTNSEDRKNFKWSSRQFNGQLKSNDYSSNPQYLVTLIDVDKEDNDDTATLIVSLMQKDSQIKRINENNEPFTQEPIRFSIFKILTESSPDQQQQQQPSVKFNLSDLGKIADSGPYTTSRTVTRRFKLPPGTYVIIPSSYYDVEVNFLLRLFTETEIAEKNLLCLEQDPDVTDTSVKNVNSLSGSYDEYKFNKNYDYNNYNIPISTDYNGQHIGYYAAGDIGGTNEVDVEIQEHKDPASHDIPSGFDCKYYPNSDGPYYFDYTSYNKKNLYNNDNKVDEQESSQSGDVDADSEHYKRDMRKKREFKGPDGVAYVDVDCKDSSVKEKCVLM